jgi:hypothetical protein
MAENQPINKVKEEFYEIKPFVVPKYQVKFKGATKLSDIEGYSWYSPAALYIWGRFSDVNLSDIIIKLPDLKFFWYRFEKPIFKGFSVGGDPSWNHALWAIETRLKDKFIDFVLSSVQLDIANKIVYNYALQEITIADPLTHDKSGLVLPTGPQTNIFFFAVLSNNNQIAFDTRKPFTDLPHVVKFKPDPVHVNSAKKLFMMPGLNTDKAFDCYREILLAEGLDQNNSNKDKK